MQVHIQGKFKPKPQNEKCTAFLINLFIFYLTLSEIFILKLFLMHGSIFHGNFFTYLTVNNLRNISFNLHDPLTHYQ